MLAEKAIAEVKRFMGFRQDGDEDILDWMQLGQDHLEKNWPTRPLPWFLITERISTSTAGDEERVARPDGFLAEYEDDGMWVIDSNGGEHLLCKYDADDLRRYQQRRTNFNTQIVPDRMPIQYAVTGKYFRLFPKPDIAYTVKMMCYAQDVPPALTEENLWLEHAPYVLIGWAGEKFAMAARDSEALTIFNGLKTASMASLDIATMDFAMTNRRMAMGETY